MEMIGDFTTTLVDALDEIDSNWREYPGLIVAGTHTPKFVEETISRVREAVLNGEPFLGICHGYQIAVISYARDILGIKDATSEEYGTPGTFVISKRKAGLVCGEGVDGESYWSNFDVNSDIIKLPIEFQENIFAVPYHPEYESHKARPHPFLVNFLEYAELRA